MFGKRVATIAMSLLVASSSVWASTAKDLETAAQKGQVAFVLLTDGTTADISGAKATIQSVTKQNKKSVMVELDRSDPANADLVAKYRMATAPVPLILALSPNGAITGAIQSVRATPEILAKMIPSPKKAEIINALSQGNAVLITAYRKGMAVKSVDQSCATACQQMAGKCVQVKVDMDDPAEAGFLTDMKINMASTAPVTMAVNAQGQIAGSFTGDVQVTQLVASATKKIGGCCPSTVSKPNASCGPTKQ